MDSLLSVTDIKDDVKYILDLASKIKAGEMEEKPLEGPPEQGYHSMLECTSWEAGQYSCHPMTCRWEGESRFQTLQRF